MMFLVLLCCILFNPRLVYAAVDSSCNDNCKCCENEECHIGVNNWTNVCKIGCIDGHRGARCYEICQHPNCKSCGYNTDETACTACYDGYHLGRNEDCTSKCPSNCISCTSSTRCTECKEGFHNKDGSKTCKYALCPKNCECSETKCIACNTGFYNASTNCSSACPRNCNSCVSKDKCDECNKGFYNGYGIDNNRDFQLNNCTNKCRDTCAKCNAYNNCSECVNGKHGLMCQENCSVGCKDNTCLLESGNCNCSMDFSGDKCIECADGIYGQYCNQTCQQYCKNNKCEFSTGKCYGCEKNRFGRFCYFICSDKCNSSKSNESRCDQLDGKCIYGCQNGYYGITCNITCNNLCIDHLCEQDIGRCINGCDGQHDDPACTKSGDQVTDPPNVTAPIAGASVAMVLVIAGIIVAVILLRRRRIRKDTGGSNMETEPNQQAEIRGIVDERQLYANIHGKQQREDSQNMEEAEVNVEDVVVDEQNHADPDKDYYNFPKDHWKIKVTDLFSYVTKEHVDLFAKDFQNLPKPDDLSEVCKVAKKPENIALNRYNGIYPCPTEKTTDKFTTFWRMVWHENTEIVVMLTNLRESSGMKCEQYWPEKGEEHYGHVKVECRSEEVFAEYTVRIFTISKGEERRNLTHLHYTAWPDKGVPSEVTSLVEFRQRVQAVPIVLDGPVVVHCSAGVGRTGTYIALDILTNEGETEESVNVFNCVSKMREQRVNMVQTAEQYEYLHKALVHALTFECEEIIAEEVQTLSFKADDMFNKMFRTLKHEVDKEKDYEVAAREENRKTYADKSRRHSDVPGDRGRVRLFLRRKTGSHDYINAVFISSFKIKNLFIAAQSPLPGTVEDFLCMIYQQDSSCVIALESLEQPLKQNDVGEYLPADNETYRCGSFTVTSSKCETKPQYIVKKLSIQNAEKRGDKTVYHFQYTKWGKGENNADSAKDFVHFVKDVEKYVNQRAEDAPNIVVHCLNGYERSGLFCVVYTLLEKLEAERQVSVVNIIRRVRAQRRCSVSNVEQLKFCYQCIAAYLESYNTYSNFAN